MSRLPGVSITLRSGKILLVNPAGEIILTMTLDLPCETPVVAGDLLGDGKRAIIAVDVRGSIYCFDETGQRRWKFDRSGKMPVNSASPRWRIWTRTENWKSW